MKRGAYFLAIQTFLWMATPLLVSMLTFGTFALLGNELTAERVFTSLGKKNKRNFFKVFFKHFSMFCVRH
jgi:ATP-binding cassette subfamily C (CFTR/MRP) protein 10